MEHLHVHRFLAPLQTLRKFEFIFLSVGTESFFDAYQWENLLNHLTQLVTFNFQIEDFPNTINQTIIDQYRRPFWLDRHWYVACDKHRSTLFTVPRFAPCSNSDALFPISSDYTTLPVEQHVIFVDRISKLQFDRDTSLPPYRYNHVQELDLWIPYRYENVLDLSQVQTLNVATNQWPFFEMMTLIKEQMPLINNLSLKLTYRDLRYQRLPDISLPQIRTLKLPVFGQSKKNDLFHWSRYFPCVERLTASFSSRKQLRFLIDHFPTMLNGSFHIHDFDFCASQSMKITYRWLWKHISHRKENPTNNFICQINDQYAFVFSLYLWFGDRN